MGVYSPIKTSNNKKLMFAEFLNIIFKSLKLDKNLYKNNKNFGEAGIYFAISIIILTALISIIPNNVILSFASLYFGEVKSPRLSSILFTSGFVWLLKSLYLFVVGLILFPTKQIKSGFKKTLITVGFAHSPFIFYFLILDLRLIFLTLIIYLWYSATLIVGINQVYQFNNIFKSTIIVLAPIIILIIYTLYYLSNIPNGVLS